MSFSVGHFAPSKTGSADVDFVLGRGKKTSQPEEVFSCDIHNVKERGRSVPCHGDFSTVVIMVADLRSVVAARSI